jgi:hypothetical protein
MLTKTSIVAFATGISFIPLATPASATLQFYVDVSGTVLTCVDNAACDVNPAIGTLQLSATTVNGVTASGELDMSSGTPANPGLNFLNSSVLTVINNSGTVKTVDVIVSDTDFKGPVSMAAVAGAGTWQSTKNSTITMNWFDDPANVQGADGTGNTPGTLIGTFTNTATAIVQGFSYSNAVPITDRSLFSMTVQSIYTLQPGGELLNRGQTEVKTAIPEPTTWALMLLGFAGLGIAGWRKARSATSFAA